MTTKGWRYCPALAHNQLNNTRDSCIGFSILLKERNALMMFNLKLLIALSTAWLQPGLEYNILYDYDGFLCC